MKIAIIGGGAAGFFSAISVKENYPDAEVTIFEKTNKLLAKVKISGGGRCNVTNGCKTIKELILGYPRGGKVLKKAFKVFNNSDAVKWFEARGVPLIEQDDNCIFPKSQNSQSIIDCFLSETRRLGIKIELNHCVEKISINTESNFVLGFAQSQPRIFNKLIVTTGGSPKREGLTWLEGLNHKIENPVPSLFTFNMPDEETVRELMGIVVENSLVSIQGSKLKAIGPLLITHWGMSGPAILKLSSFGARALSENNYEFNILVNWVNEPNYEKVIKELTDIETNHSNKILSNYRPYLLPERLWLYLLEKSEISHKKRWGELGKKGKHKLTSLLTNDIYFVKGKTSFRDEFVTCGGVSLKNVDMELAWRILMRKQCRVKLFLIYILQEKF